jgi:class 3 adenylate cyclase/predicted ATPase
LSFLEIVSRAKAHLREHGRVSLRALKREFDLDDEALEELVEELVDLQQVATREGQVLSWLGPTDAGAGEEQDPTAGKVAASAEPEEEPAPEGERRQLTVLFCDLVESTRLAAGLDPEDWRELVRGYQNAAAGAVERFDGNVAQYLGDGIVVYFGYPRAHENDAERAVRAGLGILGAVAKGNPQLAAQHGIELAVRIGVHTGPVVVGQMGGGEHTKTLALGDTTNVAARLQQAAKPGSVVMSSPTLRLVQGIFVTRDLGEHSLKGRDEPIHVHQALRPSGMSSRLDAEAATGLTPLIGRDHELEILENRWAQVQEGWGQAMLICGEPGIGKSRLMYAFRERLADRSHTWLECRGSPYSQDSALQPVLELQRQALGFEVEEAAELKLARLEAGLEAVGFDLAETVSLMAGFHSAGLPESEEEPTLSPEERREQTLELLTEWVLRLGREQPVVLLMEDLHWVDPSTVELLGMILERITREPVLLLLTYRPNFEPPWGARSHIAPMLLARLTRSQMRDLIRKAARESDLPEAWVEEIVRRADGVPLFAEELTRAALGSSRDPTQAGATPALHVPETLQDPLMSRLDALGEVKELAQLGAVIGREFSYDLILNVSPLGEGELREALGEAVRQEFFYQRGTPPEATYLFKHALIRDVAYQSLLRSTRQRHHRRVAETLTRRMPEVAEEQPELVAYHLTEAGESERAIAYWQRAGERANAQVAYEEAIRHLRRGLALLEGLAQGSSRDQQELGLQVALGRALTTARGWAHSDAKQTWERAQALCDPLADPLRTAAIYCGLYDIHIAGGDPHKAFELATWMLRLGEHAGEAMRLFGEYLVGCTLWYLGRFRESRAHLGEAISRYEPEPFRRLLAEIEFDIGAGPHSYAAWDDWFLGFPDRAWGIATQALEHARRNPQHFSSVSALVWAGQLAMYRREWTRLQELAAEIQRLARARDFAFLEAAGNLLRALGDEAERGDASAADAYTSAMAQAAGTGNRGVAPLIIGKLAELQMRAGRLEDAALTVEGALSIARDTGQVFYDPELHRQKGEILLRMQEHSEEEAESIFRGAIEIARAQESRSLELRAATSLARLWQRQGKRDAARELLAPVYEWFTEGFDTQDLKDAKALLVELA